MKTEPCHHEVSTPVTATTLLVDLRNFTPNLNAAKVDDRGVNGYCYFLSDFYALCLDACLIALPSSRRQQPPLYMSSTGDGVLIVFSHDSHVRHGFLAALILHNVLQSICEHYNSRLDNPVCPRTSFGIGVESGDVCRIRASPPTEGGDPIIDTYIGSCINVAARAEAMSKVFYRANTIIAETTNELLCQEIFGESYNALIRQAFDPAIPDKERLAVHDKMNSFNRGLCLTFLHHHNLKGVDKPVPLFRVADASAYAGNPRFDSLVAKLTSGAEQVSEVVGFLKRYAQESVPGLRVEEPIRSPLLE